MQHDNMTRCSFYWTRGELFQNVANLINYLIILKGRRVKRSTRSVDRIEKPFRIPHLTRKNKSVSKMCGGCSIWKKFVKKLLV